MNESDDERMMRNRSRLRDETEATGIGYPYLSRRRLLQLTTLGIASVASVSPAAARSFPQTLSIASNGGRFSYTVAASGDLAKSSARGASIDSNDTVWESTATGQGGSGGVDSYEFSGELVVLDVTGDATAYLDGERINPNQYLDNVLTLEGNGSRAEYTVATSGPLEYTGANNATINSNDDRWGSTVTGQVGSGGRDSYKFSGELVVFDVTGDVTAYLNGERINPDDYSDSVLTIEGHGSVAEYTLATSGTLKYTGANNATIDPNDDRWGSTATGQVGSGGRDSYKFSGELVVLNLNGSATPYLNGERINPDEYLDNVVTIEGHGSSAEYTLATSGTLEYTGANGATIDRNDDLRGSTATGQVGGGRDSYKFAGEITDIRVEGDATAYLNGTHLDIERGVWSEKASLPVNQSDAGGSVLNGKLYYFGGFRQGPGLNAVTRTFIYEPATGGEGTWKRVENLPRALWAPCGVATENAIYSFGGAPSGSPYNGVSPSDEIFRYRPNEGWIDLTAKTGVRSPYPNYAMAGVYNPADGLIYCMGGGTNVTRRESAVTHDDRRRPGTFDESRIWTFDPQIERVANPDLARMPEAKRWHSVGLVEIDGQQYIHAMGGRLGSARPTNTNFRFDIATGQWTRRRDTPIAGTFATKSNPVIDNHIYLTHARTYTGHSPEESYTTDCYRYDPVQNAYLKQPNAKHRRDGAVDGVIDGELYVAGGHIKRYDQDGDGYHDCVRNTTAFTPW